MIKPEKRTNGWRYRKYFKHPITNKRISKSVTYADNKKKTQKLAEQELDTLIREEIERIEIEYGLVSTDLTFEQFINMYKVQRMNTLKPSTQNRHKIMISQLEKLDILFIPLVSLNERKIALINKELTNSSLLAFNSMISWGINNNLINSDAKKYIKKYQPQTKTRVEDLMYFEPEDIANIFQKLEKINTFISLTYRYMVEFLVLTGVRCGEVFALEWEDIHDNEVDITKSAFKQKAYTPKTKSSIRTVYVPDRVMEIKNTMLELHKQYGIASKVIFSNSKGKILNGSCVAKYFKSNCLPTQMHLYRHTFISLAIDNGVPKDLVKDMVGHTDTKLIDKIYYHKTEKGQVRDKNIMMNLKFI